MIGIAYTGSGKTLVFVIPIVAFCLEQEMRLPFSRNEGPYGLILVPSVSLPMSRRNYFIILNEKLGKVFLQRELAKQIHDIVCHFAECFRKNGFPMLRSCCCIGGVPIKDQLETVKR